jgi:hypothetical protein
MPFNRSTIESLNRNQYGVYGIFQARGHWVYVGMGDIRQRLLDHLNGDNPCITRNGPTHFYTWVTADAERQEERLIAECRPLCNVRAS